MATRGPNPKQYVLSQVASQHAGSGVAWWTGFAGKTLFTTITPPNAPSCVPNSQQTGSIELGAIAPTSYHTGGVNCAYGDGSVQFISDTIDAGPSTARCVVSGPSQFGVWGALGSRNGGESKSL